MLAELMEMSSASDGRLGLGEELGQGAGLGEGGARGRPGRQLGGSALIVVVVVVVDVVPVVVTVGVISEGRDFTSWWRPRLRTCPSLSRGVA